MHNEILLITSSISRAAALDSSFFPALTALLSTSSPKLRNLILFDGASPIASASCLCESGISQFPHLWIHSRGKMCISQQLNEPIYRLLLCNEIAQNFQNFETGSISALVVLRHSDFTVISLRQ